MKPAILTIILAFSLNCIAQNKITLQQCADKLLNNHLIFTSVQTSLNENIISNKFHYWTLIPSLNLTSGLNTNFGRRVDPFTNTFATNTVNSQSIGLSSNITLFNGFNFLHTQRILDLSNKQLELNVAVKKNERLLQLIELYVILCKQEIQIQQSKVRIERYHDIQRIQNLLIQESRISTVDTLKSINSLLNEKLLLGQLESEQRIKMIELNYLIGDPLSTLQTFDLSSISTLTTRPKFLEEFEIEKLALQTQIDASKLKSERTSILPNLTANGNLGTGFSTNNKDYSITGNPTKPYNDQLRQNLYQGIGLYLTVPILNHGEWLKSKLLNELRSNANDQELELKKIEIEQKKIIKEQEQILKQSEINSIEQIAINLQTIYDKTLLIYQEGRTTYIDLEITFLEWQSKLVELETLKIEYQKLLLFN